MGSNSSNSRHSTIPPGTVNWLPSLTGIGELELTSDPIVGLRCGALQAS